MRMGSGECTRCKGTEEGLDKDREYGSVRNQKWVTYQEMGELSING